MRLIKMTSTNVDYQLLNNKFIILNFSVIKSDNNEIKVSYQASIFNKTESGEISGYDYVLISNNFNFTLQKLIGDKLKTTTEGGNNNQSFLDLFQKANSVILTIDMNNTTLDAFENSVYTNVIQFYSSLTTDITFSLYDYDRTTGVFNPIV